MGQYVGDEFCLYCTLYLQYMCSKVRNEERHVLARAAMNNAVHITLKQGLDPPPTWHPEPLKALRGSFSSRLIL